jgi:alanine-glyoxylate transaminase / serine-glyoxylate transaminase / serine-pyruvate transaminase
MFDNPIFIPGPTNVPDRVRRAMMVAQEDQRSPKFPELSLPLFADLKKVFKTDSGQVFMFPSSGTGCWEAAITNTLSPGDKVLASRFGQFSHLWIDLCQRVGLEVIDVDVEWGEGVPLEEYQRILTDDKNHEIKAVLACQNETATGVTSDIAGVRKALDAADHPALLYVDGVSSIASIDFRMDEWGVDLAISGSQKGFMLPAGLGFVCASQKALEAAKSSKCRRAYFEFNDMINTNKDGYFPYTPATNLMYGLRESLNMIFEEGLENVFKRHHRMAEGVRRAVYDGWGLSLAATESKWHSDTVSAIRVPEGFDAAQVISIAKERYGLSYGAGLSKVAGKVFRIGHLGLISEIQLLGGIAGAEMAMRDVGIDVKAGSGVAAAEEYYRQTATPVEMTNKKSA